MNKEDKDLLLKDLGARLTYGVIVKVYDIDGDFNSYIESIGRTCVEPIAIEDLDYIPYVFYKLEDITPLNRFSRESLFTLYMLNETISRLKYEDESRGHGTMNFIDSFIELGKLGDINSYFTSILNIISGHIHLTCDNRYKPYKKGDMRIISLNEDNDIKKLPNNHYLKTETEYFPGPILECKIFFEHIN